MDEIGSRFGGDGDGPRRDLFNGFVRWRSLLVRRNLPLDLFVDGSFTSDKGSPRDVDVALRLPPATRELIRAVAASADLLKPDRAKSDYLVDPWYFFDGDEGPDPVNYVEFFCQLRIEEAQRRRLSPSHIRGILRVGP